MKRLLLVIFIICSVALGQVTVTSPTTSFSQVKLASGAVMTDFLGDQQTGQGSDDFIANGFYYAVNQSPTDPTQLYRFVFDKYETKGFVGNLRVGLDANADGAVDLFFGVSTNANNQQIVFQLPTSTAVGSNTSPSTTALGSAFGNIAITATNYSYTQVDPTSNDGMLTFSVLMSSINSALTGTGLSVNTDTFVRYIAYTATNQNAINQDLYGVNGGVGSSTATFISSGAFTEYKNFNNQAPIVPEPSTYGFIMMSLFLGFIGFRKWRKRNE